VPGLYSQDAVMYQDVSVGYAGCLFTPKDTEAVTKVASVKDTDVFVHIVHEGHLRVTLEECRGVCISYPACFAIKVTLCLLNLLFCICNVLCSTSTLFLANQSSFKAMSGSLEVFEDFFK
jgi:hypothetical protein